MVPPPAAIIYLTDGFGQAPQRSDFPTLWSRIEEGVDWLEIRAIANDIATINPKIYRLQKLTGAP